MCQNYILSKVWIVYSGYVSQDHLLSSESLALYFAVKISTKREKSGSLHSGGALFLKAHFLPKVKTETLEKHQWVAIYDC